MIIVNSIPYIAPDKKEKSALERCGDALEAAGKRLIAEGKMSSEPIAHERIRPIKQLNLLRELV